MAERKKKKDQLEALLWKELLAMLNLTVQWAEKKDPTWTIVHIEQALKIVDVIRSR